MGREIGPPDFQNGNSITTVWNKNVSGEGLADRMSRGSLQTKTKDSESRLRQIQEERSSLTAHAGGGGLRHHHAAWRCLANGTARQCT